MYKYLIVLILAFFINGCSSKNYFEPKIVDKKEIKFDGEIDLNIAYTYANIAVLEDRTLLCDELEFEYKVPDKQRVISVSGGYVISVDESTNILLYNPTKTIIIPSPTKIVSATIDGNLLAVLSIDNTAKVIDIQTKQTLFINKGSEAFSIDAKMAQPLFVDSLILIPTIDGKLDVVDRDSFTLKSSLIVDSSESFANIIYLKNIDDKLIIATRNRIKSIYNQKEFNLKLPIKMVKIIDNNIYIFGRDGKIQIYDLTLVNQKQQKFKFARFATAIQSANSIKLYERGGFLIDISKDLQSYKIYKLEDELEDKLFVINKRIYIGNRYFKIK